MSEEDKIGNRLEAFRDELRLGFDLTFELLEEYWLGEVLPVDPFSMGIGERTFEELGEEEKNVVKQVMLMELGLDDEELEKAKVREYEDPNKRFRASVYRTNREDKGIFLHELVFADGEKRWAIGANKDI
jgi:hypothetical protein